MSLRRSRTARLVVTLLVAACCASSAYAYTASLNNTTGTAGGFGSGGISGYAPNAPAFTLDLNNNPQNITQLSLSLSPANASSVSVQLNNGSAWYTCSAGASPSCSTKSPQAIVTSGLNKLSVVAAQ